MSTSGQLVTGLGGAIGSHYLQNRNQLFFVEFNGKLSRLDLVRALDAVVFTGTTTINANQRLDLNDGTSIHGGDIWWEQPSPGVRNMRPQGLGQIFNLGMINYDALTYAELEDLPYTQTPLNGNPGPANQLGNGDVFAVSLHNGNFAKVQVLHYDANIQVRWVTYRLQPRYHVLGTGYNQPEDVVVNATAQYAYVTERVGNLLRVDLTHPNRAQATVVSAGMTAPHQLALDEDRNQAYLVEFANPGHLYRIDLTSGARTALVSTLQNAVGLLITRDRRFAYVSEQLAGGGRVSRIDLTSGHRDVLPPTFTNPFMLTWTDAGEGGIMVPQRDPANEVSVIDLTAAPVTSRLVRSGVPVRPSSVAVTAPNRILVCSDQEIDEYDLAGAVFNIGGPLLLGVGLVPVSRISSGNADPDRDGYADTTVDPSYFFQVKDAPFGGTLAIMFNHERAISLGAAFYQLVVDAQPQQQPWSDYLWSTSLSSFELQTTSPSNGSFYRVRLPGEIWFNHWLGYLLDTTGLTTGRHTLTVRLWRTASAAPGTEVGNAADPSQNMVLRIDNQRPQASIDQILHAGSPVGTCAIVNGGADNFTFNITAQDPEQHLLSWTLTAMWGDNQSATVDADSYSHHVAPNKRWSGLTGPVPAVTQPPPWHATVAGDPFSHWCAHTFYLSVWDRVINGYGYIHNTDYHKSITIMIPPPPP